jgi:two-component system sensor histidine kinase YesM
MTDSIKTIHIKTVKGRVFFLLAMFALIITLLALLFSFNMINSFQRRIAVRSAENNLQLIAGLIEQDLRDLSTLGRWCGHNEQVSLYFISEDSGAFKGIEAWNRLSDEFINNRAGRYVRRLIVCNTALTKFLQVGNSTSISYPLSIYNLGKIFESGIAAYSRDAAWQAIVADSYIFPGDVMVIPFLYPVYSPYDGREIGTVFLAANTAIITDKLRNYHLSNGSKFYLSMGDEYYLIENDYILNEKFPYSITAERTDETTVAAVSVFDGRDEEGRQRTLVTYPMRDKIALTQVLSPAHYAPFSGAWPALAAGFGVLIVLLIVMAYGISLMTRQISDLMDRRLEDEKKKRDLEYRMLQSQVNPHFLYNTLNSIKWMATIQNAVGIAEMTTALSRFLKILSKENRELVVLRDELLLLEDYLVIQKYRYGGSVNFEKKIEDGLLDTPIPRFILQPLAENAIFHGIEPKGSGNIVLLAEKRDADVFISLTDDGLGMVTTFKAAAEPPEAGESIQGFGIHSVDERLRYAFGEGYGLSIESQQGSYTTVTIRVPGKRENGR